MGGENPLEDALLGPLPVASNLDLDVQDDGAAVNVQPSGEVAGTGNTEFYRARGTDGVGKAAIVAKNARFWKLRLDGYNEPLAEISGRRCAGTTVAGVLRRPRVCSA